MLSNQIKKAEYIKKSNCYKNRGMKSKVRNEQQDQYPRIIPALGVSVKGVRLVAGRLGFYSRSGHTTDFKNRICSFRARRSAQAEVRRVLCMCCSSCMSLNSVQSFVIDCNGPPIGLNNMYLHPLFPIFTFTTYATQLRRNVAMVTSRRKP